MFQIYIIAHVYFLTIQIFCLIYYELSGKLKVAFDTIWYLFSILHFLPFSNLSLGLNLKDFI